MRTRLFIIAMAISLLALLTPAPKSQAVTTDCNTVATVCSDMGDMMYDMCVMTGGTVSDCTWSAALYTIKCMQTNGCEPVNN